MRMNVSPKISFTLWLRFNSDEALIRARVTRLLPEERQRRADRPCDSWFIHSRDTINLITRTLKQSKVWWVIGCVSLTRLILASNRCRLPHVCLTDHSFRRFTNNILWNTSDVLIVFVVLVNERDGATAEIHCVDSSEFWVYSQRSGWEKPCSHISIVTRPRSISPLLAADQMRRELVDLPLSKRDLLRCTAK